MKRKLNFLITMTIMSCVLVTINSCAGGGSSPSDKAMDIVSYMQDKDFSSYVDELYIAPGQEMTGDEKKEIVVLFEEKGSLMLEENKGIESYELVSEVLAEDANSATVTINIVYGNGKSEAQALKMIKDANGDWKNQMK